MTAAPIAGRASVSVLAAGLSALAVSACGAFTHDTGASAARAGGAAHEAAGAQPGGPADAASSSSLLTPHLAGPPCGLAAAGTLAGTAGLVARRIYSQERASSGVSADQRQVERYAPLVNALAGRSRAAVRQAVRSLVYSGTHIVRLRVTQNGALLADVGGPYILAPVGGEVRLHGRSVGRYLVAVQDDLGYVKLEMRFIGDPLALYMGSRRLPLEGTLAVGRTSSPASGTLRYRGVRYEVYSLSADAFPSGSLRISLLVPVPGSLAGKSCAQIRVAELARIARRIWRRFTKAGAPLSAHVNAVRALTGGLSYVRSGSRQIAGSTQPGPPALPAQGTVRYRGATYAVSSFAAGRQAANARVYDLVAF